MPLKCPKCKAENPDTQRFCGDCGTELIPKKDISASYTETLQAPTRELERRTILAGRYEIIEELGHGGMGKVYKVFDQEVQAKMALKLIRPEVSADKNTIDRFRNELRIARDISHKNICRMYDLGKEAGNYFITMEYVSGEDLKSFIRRSKQLVVGTAIFIAKQVCEGLAEAHRLGIVHRDLKPGNIMIDKEGNARIMDFGIARSISAKGITGAGIMIGTPEYMSPEQVEAKEVDQRSDIYSLGIILYEMLTGQVPFEGDTPFAIGIKQKSEVPKDPKTLNAQIPDDLGRLILKCLEKEKENRYQSAEELRADLERIEKDVPTSERPVPKRKAVTPKPITLTISRKKLLIPASVIVLAVLAAVIWFVVIKREVPLLQEQRRSIAIISFENQTGEKAYDYLRKAIPNLLITSLEQSGYVGVTTWERMDDILKQMGNKEVEFIDRDLGFKLCRLDGIETIVLGSFVKAGDMFATDVKVLDVETKSLLKSASSKGDGVRSILEKQIDELSREISRGLGISERRLRSAQLSVADATTGSMDAYNFFLRGREDRERYYFDDARRFLERAVEIDPTFALAYLYLADVHNILGDTKARDEAISKAKSFSQKATEKERLFIEASYAIHIERDSEKRFRILDDLVKKYPKEKRAHYDLGLEYKGRSLFDDAVGEFKRALELDPNFGFAINELAYTYAQMGDSEKAIEYFEKYASVSPGDANPLDSMAEMYLRMGRLDEALVKYKEALEIKPDFGSDWEVAYIYALKEDYAESKRWIEQYTSKAPSPGAKAEGYVWKGFYGCWLGSYHQALSELRRAEEIAQAVGNDLWKAWVDYVRAWIQYDRGELELSQECFNNWFDIMAKNFPSTRSFFQASHSVCLGLLDVERGRIDSTISGLNEIKLQIPKENPPTRDRIQFRYDLLLAEALLAKGSCKEAVAAGQNMSSLGMIRSMFSWYVIFYNSPFLKDVLARAYQEQGQIDKAIAEYERLISFDPERPERFLIHPRYHYRLGKLYEQNGQSNEAIRQYETFLEFLKDADPGLPEVEDAEKRLAGLKQ